MRKITTIKQTFAYTQTHTIKDSRLNNAANPSGLEEYVDILQVQQLLLDSTPSTSSATTSIACTTSNATTNSINSTAGATRHHRPRVNIQKATEYSTTMTNTTCPSSTTTPATATTPSAQLQGTCVHTQHKKKLLLIRIASIATINLNEERKKRSKRNGKSKENN